MATPSKPPALLPGLSYLHVTSSQPPQTIQDSFTPSSFRLHYVGKVGELEGEHIFEVRHPAGTEVIPRDQLPGDVVSAVKGIEGVKGVKILETKQRAKRDEF